MRHKNLITDRLESTVTLLETLERSLARNDRPIQEIRQLVDRVKRQVEFISERMELEGQD